MRIDSDGTIRPDMAPSITEQDARDSEFQREIGAAYEAFLHATGEARVAAKSRYLELLRAFTNRVLHRRGLCLTIGAPKDVDRLHAGAAGERSLFWRSTQL